MGRGRVVGVVLAALAVGCGAASSLPFGGSGAGGEGGGAGGDPLVGTWVGSASSDGTTVHATLTFYADGAAVETEAVTSTDVGACTGTLQYTGIAWSATTTTIALTSPDGGMCTGGLTCAGAGIPCTSEQTFGEICDYTLSDGDSTLVLTCEGVSTTFTRQGG
jgi:hypothetical protein